MSLFVDFANERRRGEAEGTVILNGEESGREGESKKKQGKGDEEARRKWVKSAGYNGRFE